MTTTTTTTAAGLTVDGFYPGQACAAAISAYYYTVPSVPLKGKALLDHVASMSVKLPSKTDLVAASGHIRSDGKAGFTSFYEALLEAKLEADPNYHVTIQEATDEDKEYGELSLPLQELYDAVHQQFGEKWDHRQILDFMGELDDLGITTVSMLESAFYSVIHYPDYRWEKQFAEDFYCELDPSVADCSVLSFIDWQAVWDHQLTYDFSIIEFDDSVFIFYANF
jgi:hypothetical protein